MLKYLSEFFNLLGGKFRGWKFAKAVWYFISRPQTTERVEALARRGSKKRPSQNWKSRYFFCFHFDSLFLRLLPSSSATATTVCYSSPSAVCHPSMDHKPSIILSQAWLYSAVSCSFVHVIPTLLHLVNNVLLNVCLVSLYSFSLKNLRKITSYVFSLDGTVGQGIVSTVS